MSDKPGEKAKAKPAAAPKKAAAGSKAKPGAKPAKPTKEDARKKLAAKILESKKKDEEKLEKERLELEEYNRKLEEAEEQERIKAQKEQEKREKKKQKEKERIKKKKQEGTFLSKQQKFERSRAQTLLNALQNGAIVSEVPEKKKNDVESDKEESSASGSEEESNVGVANKLISKMNIGDDKDLRAAVVCVLGHVDAGKTKILDKLRRTNVQDSEAGGITQQIGATNVPVEAIKEQVRIVKELRDVELKVPGLLIIDTPGHESFSNLRNRGSSLCDIAILVVNVMSGIQNQTDESIDLLRAKNVPFIVALNQVDRLYGWKSMQKRDVRDIIKAQPKNTRDEFDDLSNRVITQFKERGLNSALFYENPDPRNYISIVPTSAVTGEGMGNLLGLLMEYCQSMLWKKLTFSDELQATVLEVKAIPGLGTTIDVILVNGTLREGDTMIVAGSDGPIVTQVRTLLMPQPLKELRVKNQYIEYKEIRAAQGVKIAAKDLDKATAGNNVVVANSEEEIQRCVNEMAKELDSTAALNRIKVAERGVLIQASTIGSLEALAEYLKGSNIPISGARVGPVVKKDVFKCSTMLEHDRENAVILAFDVKVDRDAQEFADEKGVRIFQADVIYHLHDMFDQYREQLLRKKREEFKDVAVFPCKLSIMPNNIFSSRNPLMFGVRVDAGVVKVGTPLCVPSKGNISLGIVTSIENNHKSVEMARKDQEVCLKIENTQGDGHKMYNRHFDHRDQLVSKISRASIDACKNYFRDDLTKEDWKLVLELKKLFEIL